MELLSYARLDHSHSRFSICLIKSNLVFLTNPFFQPLNSNFCSSENIMLLPLCAASRVIKRLKADHKINPIKELVLETSMILILIFTLELLPGPDLD
jgi:hypothetical protein